MTDTTPPGPGWWTRLVSARIPHRLLFILACLASLTAVLYTLENWRGRRAWKTCRAELEGRGVNLDWDAYVPPPVPDEQNVFKVPQMTEWFVKGQTNQSRNPFMDKLSGVWNQLGTYKMGLRNGLQVAQCTFEPNQASEPPSTDAIVLNFEDPAAGREAERLVRRALGVSANGAQNLTLVTQSLDQIRPVQLALRADSVPDPKQMAGFFPSNESRPGDFVSSPTTPFRVGSVGTNSFKIWLDGPTCAATDYLTATDQLEPELKLIRDALQRPYARMDGDYHQPFAIPIPNFVMVRMVAQVLAQRAQCHLLVGQPEAALGDLTLLHGLNGLLEAKPSRRPMTLVAAMIEVALAGLYSGVVADGLRLHAWQEPQLVHIQAQLAEVDLLPLLVEAIRGEQIGVCHLFATTPAGKLNDLFAFGAPQPSLWQRIKDPQSSLLALAPRGWMFQNMTTIAAIDQGVLDAFDLTNRLVHPSELDRIWDGMLPRITRFSPYTFLASVTMPNFTKATQTTTRNQTMANEARVACALDRYRIANGSYPETLDRLVPRFLDKLPLDIVNGHPLQYRRPGEQQFVLYSVGWNLKDEDGRPDKSAAEGDWVWRYNAD